MSLVQSYILKENLSYMKHVDKLEKLIEDKLDYELENISDEYKFIGAGLYAKVYSINTVPDKVIRVEYTDAVDSLYMYLQDKEFDHVVKVYYDTILESYETGLKKDIEITVLEKLEPLEKYEQQELDYIYNYYGLYPSGLPEPELMDIMSEFDEVTHILKDIRKGLEELAKHKIRFSDLHSNNVMYDPKTGNYKLIDIT